MGEIIEDIIKRLQEVFDPQMLGERIAEMFADVIVAILTFAAF